MRECKTCRAVLPPSAFPSHTPHCRPCKREIDRGRQRSNPRDARRNDTEAARGRKRRWAKAHRDIAKEAARRAVRRAVTAGLILVPAACESCAQQAPRRRDGRRGLQAHHHAGYERLLDVVWLCPPCHRLADAALAPLSETPTTEQRQAGGAGEGSEAATEGRKARNLDPTSGDKMKGSIEGGAILRGWSESHDQRNLAGSPRTPSDLDSQPHHLTEESIRLPNNGYRMSDLAKLPPAEKEKALARLIREACKPIQSPLSSDPTEG